MQLTEELVYMLVGMAFTLVLLGVIFRFVRRESERTAAVKLERERERLYREIASYVAGGSLTIEDAERLIQAIGDSDASLPQLRSQLQVLAPMPA